MATGNRRPPSDPRPIPRGTRAAASGERITPVFGGQSTRARPPGAGTVEYLTRFPEGRGSILSFVSFVPLLFGVSSACRVSPVVSDYVVRIIVPLAYYVIDLSRPLFLVFQLHRRFF